VRGTALSHLPPYRQTCPVSVRQAVAYEAHEISTHVLPTCGVRGGKGARWQARTSACPSTHAHAARSGCMLAGGVGCTWARGHVAQGRRAGPSCRAVV
jgi:hypothetical protein